MMQTHPIDLIREQLALAAYGFGQGLMGLATALALIGLMWVSSLRPADAAGPTLGPNFTASARAGGHLGAGPLVVPTQTGAPSTPAGVCRLEFDLEAPSPVLASCAPAPAPMVVITD